MDSEIRKEFNSAYRAVAETYLAGKYGLDKLDQRFAEYVPHYIPAPWREEINKQPGAMRYISLLNMAHTERLSDADSEEIQAILKTGENKEQIPDLIERTYHTVLAGTTEPEAYYEYFADIHGRGRFPGDAIVFVFSDIPEYDEAGNSNAEAEDRKTDVFENVKSQFEAIVSEDSEDKVFLIRY
jgi:hypothetical protein